MEQPIQRPPIPAVRDKSAISSVQQYDALCRQASENLDAFWDGAARTIAWDTPYKTVLDRSDPPIFQWFTGGRLNPSRICLDEHVRAGRGDQVALYYQSERGDEQQVTYRDLLALTCRVANALRSLGVERGDRVLIYMPECPEAVAALLACARIGAPHGVVFGNFSAEIIRSRANDLGTKLAITADGTYRRGGTIPLKPRIDQALQTGGEGPTPPIDRMLVLRHTGDAVPMQDGRDVWWHDVVPGASDECTPVSLDAEETLFYLHTSGTTGVPKGAVHKAGGYMVGVAQTCRWVFNLAPGKVYWCTADIGWITGHSYKVYGPLANGVSAVLYEGAPDYPAPDRSWEIIERLGVQVYNTSPTLIRALMKYGDEWPGKHELSSLEVIGTVGEPINPAAWVWLYEKVGGGTAAIADNYWQTETGMIVGASLPVFSMKAGWIKPLPGIFMEVMDKSGQALGADEPGALVIRQPWPGMARGLHNARDVYETKYWRTIPGDVYYSGDRAIKDTEGYFKVLGRDDDAFNVSGHLISSIELENALIGHEAVAEAAFVGVDDPITGKAAHAFVGLRPGFEPGPELEDSVRQMIVQKVGSYARPKEVYLLRGGVAKTRSGKLRRDDLRAIADGRAPRDPRTSTIEDPETLQEAQRVVAEHRLRSGE